jgi:hypothetical protein
VVLGVEIGLGVADGKAPEILSRSHKRSRKPGPQLLVSL